MTDEHLSESLAVGVGAVVTPVPVHKGAPRYSSVIRGWKDGSHIIVDRPKATDNLYAALATGQEIAVRFLNQGCAFAFTAKVVDWDSGNQNPYMRITWPAGLERFAYRRFERIHLHVPCSVVWPNGKKTEEQLLDISFGGCGIKAKPASFIEDNLSLSVSLPDGTQVDHLSIVVRSVRESDKMNMIGCEFNPGQDFLINEIGFFVNSTRERNQGWVDSATARHRLVILDTDTQRAVLIKSRLTQVGIEGFATNSVVEAIYRLRLTRACAVIIHAENQVLSTRDLCALLKQCPTMEGLFIFLYGGAKETADKLVTELNLTAAINDSPNMIELLVAALVSTLSPSVNKDEIQLPQNTNEP